jgi:hypothetical protein
MSVVKTFDENQNFWKVNPQFKVLGAFKDLYNSDKTKNKDKSSKIMWAIAFRLDPSESNIYRNLEDEDKKKYLHKDFIKDPKFKWEDYEDIVDLYKSMILTQAQKSLVLWNEILELRDKELKNWYKEALKTKDIGLITELDKIVSLTSKFFADFKKIKQDFDQDEETVSRGTGNKIKSLSDSKEI